MTAPDTAPGTDDVRAALRAVIDPELGVNIVDLGLIYDIAVRGDGTVAITMTTTTRFCPASGFLREAVGERVAGLAGVSGVVVEVTYDPPWSAERMGPEASALF